MQLSDERLDLLLECLKTNLSVEEITKLRMVLLSQAGALDGVILAAHRRHLGAAVIDSLGHKGLLHPMTIGKAKTGGARGWLATSRQDYARRRDQLLNGLEEIISSLNQAGIEPLILKGSVSLLTDAPSWRYQRDIDFAICPEDGDKCVEALKTIGFSHAPDTETSPHHHHLQPLERAGLPAYVEPHIRLNGRRSDYLLPEADLLVNAQHVRFGHLKARFLRPDHFLLYGLVHHHFENLGSIFGTISLKGLYEFAHGLRALDDSQVGYLSDWLSSRPRMRAAVELWVASSMQVFGSAPPEELVPGPAAMARAKSVIARILAAETATAFKCLREDIWGSMSVLKEAGRVALTPSKWFDNYLVPTFETLTRRSGKHGDEKMKKVSGLHVDI